MSHKHAILAVLLLSAAPVAASPGSELPRPPPPDTEVSRELIDLRASLFDAGKQRALRERGRFRPLCDREGYPLVGNVTRKQGLFQPSQFCAEVRKAGR